MSNPPIGEIALGQYGIFPVPLTNTRPCNNPHRHDYDHTLMLLEGEVEVIIENEPPVILCAPAALNIPKEKTHQIRKISGERAVIWCIRKKF